MAIEDADAATVFAALGAEVRLNILRLLVRAGPEGLPVGSIQARLGIAGSTLSHHLRAMTTAGILTQARDGRVLNCLANYDRLAELGQFLISECCADAATGEERKSA